MSYPKNILESAEILIICDKCNFREIERARFARCGEHGSRVPWLQRQRPGRAGVRCSRLTLLRRARGFAATSFAFALFGDAPLDWQPVSGSLPYQKAIENLSEFFDWLRSSLKSF